MDYLLLCVDITLPLREFKCAHTHTHHAHMHAGTHELEYYRLSNTDTVPTESLK